MHDLRTQGYSAVISLIKDRQYIWFHPPQVIVIGAGQNSLLKDYQEKLRAIKTNLYEGPLPMMAELEQVRRRAKERANHHSDA
ncbi:Gamma-glutamylcyclotransferase [Dissostichus eleginoides]|uniref:Gamma-glutamylcyclotransferase n=1 Tax=Dissostichus eleginoides TaxID=100907 RepID=A0AAD9C5D9_DISEL|nr:Gamma-glutamylcyclotransferase [Dissostichus eleginoides]